MNPWANRSAARARDAPGSRALGICQSGTATSTGSWPSPIAAGRGSRPRNTPDAFRRSHALGLRCLQTNVRARAAAADVAHLIGAQPEVLRDQGRVSATGALAPGRSAHLVGDVRTRGVRVAERDVGASPPRGRLVGHRGNGPLHPAGSGGLPAHRGPIPYASSGSCSPAASTPTWTTRVNWEPTWALGAHWGTMVR